MKRDAIAIIEDIACEVLAAGGAPEARQTAKRIADEVAAQLGGLMLYIPRRSAQRRAEMAAAVIRDWRSGVGVRDLIRRYGLTEKTVYRILRARNKLAAEQPHPAPLEI